MSLPSAELLYKVVEATWPAASRAMVGPWCIRDGAGGGKRASAATAEAAFGAADLDVAERAMKALSQQPLFMIRDGEVELDALLDARGYNVIDPVTLFAAPLSVLADDAPKGKGFAMWPPLAITIAGGVSGATILALYFAPSAYILLMSPRQEAVEQPVLNTQGVADPAAA